MRIRHTFSKTLSILLTAALLLTMLPGWTLSAEAAGTQTTLDISKGNITIGSGTVSGFSSDGTQIKTANSNGYIITQSSGTSTKKIVSVTDGSVNITLQDVNINTSHCALSIASGASVNLTLEGTNTLIGEAGLLVPQGARVIIDGTGSLTANGDRGAGIGGSNTITDGAALGNCGTVIITGGSIAANGRSGAGIGGGVKGTGGTVIISGGTVNATSVDNGAGIGGGVSGNGGTVIIKGGTVTSTGSAAGIGGGACGNGGNVTITGGSVTATGNTGAAGIGGGDGSSNSGGGDGATVTITGGTVTATGNAAGIGGGTAGNGGKVTITSGNVTANGDNGGAGIGGGDGSLRGGAGGTVYISDGTVIATSKSTGAGIGGGNKSKNSGTVTISGGTVNAVSNGTGAGIGGGCFNKGGGTVTISGGYVTAAGGTGGAGIGGGSADTNGVNTDKDNGGYGVTVNISGGTVLPTHKSSGNDIGCGWFARVENVGTTVITGGSVKAFQVQGDVKDASGNVESLITVSSSTFSGNENVYTVVNNGSPSVLRLSNSLLYLWCPKNVRRTVTLWSGYAFDGGTFTVDDKGNATGTMLQPMTELLLNKGNIVLSDNSASFSGKYIDGSPATINPAGYFIVQMPGTCANTITVKDGVQNVVLIDIQASPNSGSPFSVALGASAYITLIGNNTLTGSTESAGIQAPMGATGASYSSIVINGIGTLAAIGGSGGAGIGGGNGNGNGLITILGGTVNATGGSGGAGIGSGNKSDSGCIVTISGGIVNAAGNNGGAGIGGGTGNSGNNVIVSGGTVAAVGSGSSAGIGGGSGGGNGLIRITGGSVRASSIPGTPNNGTATVYPVKVTVPSVSTQTAVRYLSVTQGNAVSYGTADLKTDAGGALYLWLPAYSSRTYTNLVTDKAVCSNYYGTVANTATINSPNVLKMAAGALWLNSSYTYGESIAPMLDDTWEPASYIYYSQNIAGFIYNSSVSPTQVGDYTCTAMGTSNSYYEVHKDFTITPKSISSGYTLTFDNGAVCAYTGSAVSPAVTVKDAGGNILASSNYNVSYSNNVDSVFATDSNPPTVTVTGKGNYTGTLIAYFTIEYVPTITANIESTDTGWVVSKSVLVKIISGTTPITKVTVTHNGKTTDITSAITKQPDIVLGHGTVTDSSLYSGFITLAQSGIYAIAATDSAGCTVTYNLNATNIDSYVPDIYVQPQSTDPVLSDKMRIVVNTGDSNINSLTVSYGSGADKKTETLTPFSSDTDPSMNQFIYYYTVTAAIPYTFTATSISGATNTVIYTPTNIDATIAAKEITAFSIGSNAGVIEETNHKINVTVPYGTDVKNLVAVFSKTGASIKVGSIDQVSGTTANDFTNPVIYTVTANDGSKQNYTVTVTVTALTNKVLISITKPNDITNIVNGTAKTAEALKLPLTVTLVTDNGNVNAGVNWDLDTLSYDVSKTTAQIFNVNGAVTLPAGVVNTNHVSLTTSIRVVVNAASGGDSSKNIITGFLMDDTTKTVPYGTSFASLNLPDKIKAVGSEISALWVKVSYWIHDTFNPTVPGTYTVKAVLDSGYVLGSGVSTPEIKVTVKAASSNSNNNSDNKNNNTSSLATIPSQTETKVDTIGNTATVTTKPDSVTTTGNTTEMQVAVPSVTTDNTSTPTNGNVVDTAKKTAVTINVPTEAIVQQLNAKKDVELSVTVPSEVARNSNKNVAVTINANKEVLEAAKKNLSDVTIKIKDADTQQMAYSWTFRGEDLAKSTAPMTDVNIAISIHLTTEVPAINEITPGKKGLVLSFNHSGILPSVASVRFSVSDKGFKPGETLYFYYYNPITKQIESLGKDTYTVDADGYVTVQIYHCSDYVLLPNAARSITLDTRTYTMASKKSYEIGVRLTNASDTTIRVTSSTKGVANVTILKNGNVKVTGVKVGLTYIMIDVYDKNNKFLTHASVRVTVQNGVKPNGNSVRQYGIF